MTTQHPGADAAGLSSTCPSGPIRTNRLYQCISIVTLVMMIFGGLMLTPPAARAASTHVNVDLTLRFDPALNATILDRGSGDAAVRIAGDPANGFQLLSNGSVNFQTSSVLIDRIIAVIRAILEDQGESVAAPSNGSEGGIVGIIYAAADAYGQPREDMLRVARCESNLDPSAVNPSSGASGLFQFMPGTWATTPFADQDIFDPVASANAAAWMWDNGRRNEWSCQ